MRSATCKHGALLIEPCDDCGVAQPAKLTNPHPDVVKLDEAALVEIEAAAEALKDTERACDITHAKPEFVGYVLKCHPAAVLNMIATIRSLRAENDDLRESVALLKEIPVVQIQTSAVDDFRSGVIAAIEARRQKWQEIADAGLPNDRTAERAATSARECLELAKQIGEMQ